MAILDDGMSVEGEFSELGHCQMARLMIPGSETIVNFSASARKLLIKAQGDYTAAPTLTKITIMEEEQETRLDVSLDLTKGGEVPY
jgi:hypothetical protein